MLTIGGTTRVFLAVHPVDLRGSFKRLFGYVAEVLRQDPKSGHWFVFTNRTRTRVKVLIYDGTGFWILNKRLNAGRFTWPVATQPTIGLRGSSGNFVGSGQQRRRPEEALEG